MSAHVEHVCTEGSRAGTVAITLRPRRHITIIGIEPDELRPIVTDGDAAGQPPGEGRVRSSDASLVTPISYLSQGAYESGAPVHQGQLRRAVTERDALTWENAV